MMVRAIVCCAALIIGLLATLAATAQSAGAAGGKSAPLDLMAFMRGGAKASGKAVVNTASVKPAKHKRSASRPAPRADRVPLPAARPEAAVLPAAAAYASHADHEVQVVTGDQLNAIDLAMLRNPPETVGAAQKTDAMDTDVNVRIAAAETGSWPGSPTALPDRPARGNIDAPRGHTRDDAQDNSKDDSWMGRFWSRIGDGFIALAAMVRQLLS